MKIGFDYGNTLTDPRLQTIAKSVSQDNDIFVISSVRPKNVESTQQQILALGLKLTDLYVLPFDDWLHVPQHKLEACLRLGIELFIDDRLDTCAYLKMNGILTLYVV